MLKSFHFLGIHVAMYSLMVFLGICAFALCYVFIVEKGEKLDRVSSNRLIFASALGIVSMYIFAYLLNSLYHSIEEGKVTWGGITWLGGVIGSFPITIALIHFLVPKARGNAVYYFSLLVPGIVLGHAFGRLGCFFAGCCFGRVTDSFLGITFPEGSAPAKYAISVTGANHAVLPTQLFEAVFEFALFFVMIFALKKHKKYNLAVYFIAYGIFRFIMEFFRADDRGSLGALLSPSQWTCIIMVILAGLLILFQRGITFEKLKKKCAEWREIARKTPVTVMGKHGVDNIAMLRELEKLRAEKIITDEEFREKKKEILKRI